ncbi:CIA30 family protein [Alkalimonas collagenimarina]|uniref:CIA30 family protein n=1 Tax=Alkalimonas collagenimarina TaxID=400390 RepID=A0ABT9H3K8_9GAMM|nr:CIA30 family protein [Alkalimonas collagenimarina]MDP4537897.1 CIA30 family protein [Alkalimonas collagenimarina]
MELQFSNPDHFTNVQMVHDTVMGGRSRGFVEPVAEPVGLRFYGELSLANNGGFASAQFRLAEALPVFDYNRITLHLAADGRAYQLRLKTPFIPGGVAYVANFQTSVDQPSYDFQPNSFVGQFRGRRVRNLPPLNFADVSHISVMLADKNSGEFDIILYSIDFSSLQSI